ncbi:acyloxyacyl hydrolase [Bacteroidota bacterium]
MHLFSRKTGLMVTMLLFMMSLSCVGQHDTITKEPHIISIDLGAYNVFRSEYIHGLFEIEFYPRWKAWFFYPFAGAFVNTNAKACFFAGITIPIKVKKHLLIRLSFAPGLYTVSDEKKDLGYFLEFRSALKLAWIFNNNSRLGVELSHISNAGLHHPNPGAETLVISYEIPIVIKETGH